MRFGFCLDMFWLLHLKYRFTLFWSGVARLSKKFSYLCNAKITKKMATREIQDKKDRIALRMAQVLIWSGIIAFFIALIMPPMGEVSNSVLAYIGEAFALGGTILLGYKWVKGSISQVCITNGLKNPNEDGDED